MVLTCSKQGINHLDEETNGQTKQLVMYYLQISYSQWTTHISTLEKTVSTTEQRPMFITGWSTGVLMFNHILINYINLIILRQWDLVVRCLWFHQQFSCHRDKCLIFCFSLQFSGTLVKNSQWNVAKIRRLASPCLSASLLFTRNNSRINERIFINFIAESFFIKFVHKFQCWNCKTKWNILHEELHAFLCACET
jgi:Zn finger protein HypA/HybF involved in hydrogenase expression